MTTTVERIMAKVDVNPCWNHGCWTFLGTEKTKGGYGQVTIRASVARTCGCGLRGRHKETCDAARVAPGQQKRYVHREVYEALVGPIPEGLELDHLCRNRACVNPEHLEPVSHADNVRRSQTAEVQRERLRVAPREGGRLIPYRMYDVSLGGF